MALTLQISGFGNEGINGIYYYIRDINGYPFYQKDALTYVIYATSWMPWSNSSNYYIVKITKNPGSISLNIPKYRKASTDASDTSIPWIPMVSQSSGETTIGSTIEELVSSSSSSSESSSSDSSSSESSSSESSSSSDSSSSESSSSESSSSSDSSSSESSSSSPGDDESSSSSSAGGGLPEWANSFNLVVDSSKVDSELTDFPTLVRLGNASGIASTDTTNIFTELASNSGKFTIQDSNGVDLDIEVEMWDNANETAALWVKIPTVASGADTTLTLYYDSTHDDMSNVGVIGSVSGQAVWDNNYEAVYHLGEVSDGTSGEFKDSTSNGFVGTGGTWVNNTTIGNYTHPERISSEIGYAQDFNGTTKSMIRINDTTGLALNNTDFTISCLMRPTSNGEAHYMIAKTTTWMFGYRPEGNLGLTFTGDDGGGWATIAVTSDMADFTLNNWYYTSVAQTGTTYSFYKNDDSPVDRTANNIGATTTTRTSIGIEDNWGSGQWYEGIDEIRVSTIRRSDGWQKADYYSCFDTLITYT